jgi:hypothetical protein
MAGTGAAQTGAAGAATTTIADGPAAAPDAAAVASAQTMAGATGTPAGAAAPAGTRAPAGAPTAAWASPGAVKCSSPARPATHDPASRAGLIRVNVSPREAECHRRILQVTNFSRVSAAPAVAAGFPDDGAARCGLAPRRRECIDCNVGSRGPRPGDIGR